MERGLLFPKHLLWGASIGEGASIREGAYIYQSLPGLGAKIKRMKNSLIKILKNSKNSLLSQHFNKK